MIFSENRWPLFGIMLLSSPLCPRHLLRRERPRADVPRLPHPRGAARAPGPDVLGRGTLASDAVDARAGAVLRGAAGRRAAGARRRSRMAARLVLWSAACLLVRRNCLHAWRCARPLCAVAALRDCDLLGGVRARPPHRRHGACRHGDPADGRHQPVHGAHDQFRADCAGDAAHGADAAALLDGSAAGNMDLLGRGSAWRRACCC